jgi:hypothetical protein
LTESLKLASFLQVIQKRMVRFQNILRNVFLTLHGHKILCQQQQQLLKFHICYQQFASRAYCGVVRPVSKMASQLKKAFCVLRFEMSRSVITMQREIRTWFKKYIDLCFASFLNLSRNSRCICNHRSGHLKTDSTGNPLLLRRHLRNWSRGLAVSLRS